MNETSEKNDRNNNLAVLLKYTLLGIASAFVLMYFMQHPFWPANVTLKEVNDEEARQLAEDYRRNGVGTPSYAGAVEKAAPAVVNIYTAKTVTEDISPMLQDPLFRRFFGDQMPSPRKHTETSLGSGVIISEEGYILTNNHVIEKADEIQVALRDGRNALAQVVGSDPESDLAVLKIRLGKLPSITLGHSATLKVGDVVLAIGNPFGVGQTVTMGIISATGRDRLGLSTFEDFIQTDAAINPGNSGGALINAFGHLVGINTAIFSQTGGSQGIGFAIPIDDAKDITAQIIEHGHVVRGWIGIEIQNMTPALAEAFGLDEVRGVIVAGVLRKGPADQAGFRPGDIIIEIEGEAVSDSTSAVKRIAKAKPGTRVEVTVLRNGRKVTLEPVTSQRPVPAG